MPADHGAAAMHARPLCSIPLAALAENRGCFAVGAEVAWCVALLARCRAAMSRRYLAALGVSDGRGGRFAGRLCLPMARHLYRGSLVREMWV